MSTPKIEVKSLDLVERKFKNDDGSERVFHEQSAFFHRGDGCVFPTNLRVTDAKKPHAVGMYDIAPDSFYAGKYGRIEFAPRLVEAKPAPSKGA